MIRLLSLAIVMVVVAGVRVYGDGEGDVIKIDVSGYAIDGKKADEDIDFYTLKDKVKVVAREIKDDEGGEIRVDRLVNGGEIGVDRLVYGGGIEKSTKGLVDDLIVLDKIINIGYTFWDVVFGNKPVSNVYSTYATALPMGIKNAGELSGWSKPRSYLVSFYFENIFGIDVIKVRYRVTYIYGGSYKGKGRYLAGVWAIAENVEVLRGFSFNMRAEVPTETIVNVGSMDKPVAGLELKVKWKAESWVKSMTGTGVYYIQGDGYFEEIADPFSSPRVRTTKKIPEIKF